MTKDYAAVSSWLDNDDKRVSSNVITTKDRSQNDWCEWWALT